MRLKCRMSNPILLERIEERLEALGLSARAASLKAGGSADLIRNIQRKPNASVTSSNMVALSEALECSVDFLLGLDEATGSPSVRTLNVIGYIGAGAEFHGLDGYAKGSGMEDIDAPPGCGPDAVALIIRGDSMFPVYKDADILIYDEKRTDIDSFINQECVCRLADGRTLLKTVERGLEDFHTLTSFNSPPIRDVALEWVAKIKWVQKR